MYSCYKYTDRPQSDQGRYRSWVSPRHRRCAVHATPFQPYCMFANPSGFGSTGVTFAGTLLADSADCALRADRPATRRAICTTTPMLFTPSNHIPSRPTPGIPPVSAGIRRLDPYKRYVPCLPFILRNSSFYVVRAADVGGGWGGGDDHHLTLFPPEPRLPIPLHLAAIPAFRCKH